MCIKFESRKICVAGNQCDNLAPSGYNSLERLQTRAARIVLKDSTLFSAFSLSRYIEIGHRLSRPVDECSEEKREGLGREKYIQDET